MKESNFKMLEIGIGKEAPSLRTWEEYFKKAIVYGIDSSQYVCKINEKRVYTFYANQGKKKDLNSFINKYGSDYAIIIDDGCHRQKEIQISFGSLFKHVSSGGYYIIEDVSQNSVIRVIERLKKTGKLKSKYIDEKTACDIENNIEFICIYYAYKYPLNNYDKEYGRWNFIVIKKKG